MGESHFFICPMQRRAAGQGMAFVVSIPYKLAHQLVRANYLVQVDFKKILTHACTKYNPNLARYSISLNKHPPANKCSPLWPNYRTVPPSNRLPPPPLPHHFLL